MHRFEHHPIHSSLFGLLASSLAALSAGCAGPEPSPAEALRQGFPEQAALVLEHGAGFSAVASGFEARGAGRLSASLPRSGREAVRFRLDNGLEIRVREAGASGEAVSLDRAIAYERAGGTSFWTTTEGGYEEWLHLDAGAAPGEATMASWEVLGATLRERSDAVEIADAAGVVRLRVTAPAAYAAGGRPVGAHLSVHGATIDLAVDTAGEAVLVDPAWTTVASAPQTHQQGVSALLSNSKVLVSNGDGSYANLYNPATNTWSSAGAAAYGWSLTDLTATLLGSGKVLVAGGDLGGGTPTQTAELYNPSTNTWALTGSQMIMARFAHASVRLANGMVIATGGVRGQTISTTDLYDPTGDTWYSLNYMQYARFHHTATLLGSGKVLVAGGAYYYNVTDPWVTVPQAELYDFSTDTWSSAGSLATGRQSATATMLQSGKVLVTGGDDGAGTAIASAELYDPATNTWATTGSMATARTGHAATALQDGRVLVTGGSGTSTAELYDPATGAWSAASSMAAAHTAHTATLLSDGRVLIAGGQGTTVAEIYDPRPICVTLKRGTLGTVIDAQLNAAAPTTNYGSVIAFNSGWTSGTERRSLLSFDLAAIPSGATINSATVSLWETLVSGTTTVNVYRATSAWSESTVTWSSASSAYDPTLQSSFSNHGATGAASFSLTSLVRSWYSGAQPNDGMMFVQPAAGTFTQYASSEATTASQRPALAVCYTLP